MPLLVKISEHRKGTFRFCVPKDISTKYHWSKDTTFMLYTFEDKILIVEPTEDLTITTEFSADLGKGNKIFYLNPCKGYKVFSFYIPQDISEKLHLQNFKLFAVHESGNKAVFLEAFPHGTKK